MTRGSAGRERSHACTLPPSNSRTLSRRQGVVLITSLSLLVVLALMATVFATLSSIERAVSHNYVDAVRARFLADSGVHHAIGALTAYLDTGRSFVWRSGEKNTNPNLIRQDRAWAYEGEDINENGVPVSSADVINPGQINTSDVPLEICPNPSFAIEDTSIPPAGGPSFPSPPKRIFIDGIPTDATVNPNVRKPLGVGVTGTMDSGTYGRNSDIYTTRLVDANSLIYINDDNPNIPRLIDLVFYYLGENNKKLKALRPPVFATGDLSSFGVRGGYGYQIWQNRPYYSLIDLERAKLPKPVFDALMPYFATHAWVDNKVVNPVPLSEYEVRKPYRKYPDGGYLNVWRSVPPVYVRPTDPVTRQHIYRYGRGRTATGERVNDPPLQFYPYSSTINNQNISVGRINGGIYGWDELNPQWIEVTSRAPIDINFACREVLMAMVEGLQGFFALEAASNIPEYGYDFLHFMRYDPRMKETECDDLGCFRADQFRGRKHDDKVATLYKTLPIGGPASGTAAGAPSAVAIVNEILKSRTQSGPFTSWEDFHKFCDDLVGPPGSRRAFDPSRDTRTPPWRRIWDDRFDKKWENDPRNWIASQAIADVLKANFNPNLHLNVLNPNAPLLMRVDKTQLIVSSTEGTLRPMGIFRIDSLGRVLQPKQVGGDAFGRDSSGNPMVNTIVAEARVTALVKCYDVAHHTTQKDFYDGARFVPVPPGSLATSSGNTTESGPEPNAGPAAKENEYEGFVQLASIGGHGGQPAPNNGKPRFTISNGCGPQCAVLRSQMHAHYTYDFNLDGGSFTQALTSKPPLARSSLGGRHYNYQDPTEDSYASRNGGYTSPYCPTSDYNRGRGNPNADHYRMASSFRIDKKKGFVDADGKTIYRTDRYAPSDLRVDGAYSERHSALIYDPGNINFIPMSGAAAYWIKPSYEASNAGKVRTYFNLSRLHLADKAPARIPGAPLPYGEPMKDYLRVAFNPTPFGHFFIPHQLYDLARNVPYRDDVFARCEGLPMQYATLIQIATTWSGNNFRRGRANQNDFSFDWEDKTLLPRSLVDQKALDYYSDRHLQTMYGFKPRSFAFGYAFIWDTSGIAPDANPPPPQNVTRQEDGIGTKVTSGITLVKGQEIATNTASLNHVGHPHGPGPLGQGPAHYHFDPQKGDLLDQGHWTHVMVSWDQHDNRRSSVAQIDDPDNWRNNTRIFVNGRQVSVSKGQGEVGYWNPKKTTRRWVNVWTRRWGWVWTGRYYPEQSEERWTWQWFNNNSQRFDWGRDEYRHPNPIRIGSPSILNPAHRPTDTPYRYESNYPADSTIDEFYVWGDSLGHRTSSNDPQQNTARTLFSRGRYYNRDEATFTSVPMDLTDGRVRRSLPPNGGTTAKPQKGTNNTGYWIYGMYWTLYSDNIYDYRPTFSLRDPYAFKPYSSGTNKPPQHLKVDAEIRVKLGSADVYIPPYNTNDQRNRAGVLNTSQGAWYEEWTPFRDSQDRNRPATITDPLNFKYQVKFKYSPSPRSDQILLETPILDDIWVIYGTRESEILEWVQL